MKIIIAKDLVKNYIKGNIKTEVIRGINLSIKEGEFVSITGRSGSGKSTLLYLLSLLDVPTSGKIIFKGCDAHLKIKNKNSICRLQNFGFIFQDYALLPELTAKENVILPLMAKSDNWKDIEKRGELILKEVGLIEKLNNYPSELSGGEKQRVSIARAIINKPKVLFADEPTANLDSKRANEIMNLLLSIHKKGITIVLVSHERKYIDMAERIIKIEDGKILE